jgi:hypothetical protein
MLKIAKILVNYVVQFAAVALKRSYLRTLNLAAPWLIFYKSMLIP